MALTELSRGSGPACAHPLEQTIHSTQLRWQTHLCRDDESAAAATIDANVTTTALAKLPGVFILHDMLTASAHVHAECTQVRVVLAVEGRCCPAMSRDGDPAHRTPADTRRIRVVGRHQM